MNNGCLCWNQSSDRLSDYVSKTMESELVYVLCVVPAVCYDPETSRVKTASCKITSESVEGVWVTGCYQRVSCLMGVHRGSVWIKEQLIKMSRVQVSSASFISRRAFWLIYALQIKKGCGINSKFNSVWYIQLWFSGFWEELDN